MSGTIRLPVGMLNQRISHLLSNLRGNIPVQFHRVFNIRAQLCVAGWGFGNTQIAHLIVAIIIKLTTDFFYQMRAVGKPHFY